MFCAWHVKWRIHKYFTSFYPQVLLLSLKEVGKTFMNLKKAWPPATYDVISCNHSNWPSLKCAWGLNEPLLKTSVVMCAKANMLYFLWGKWQTTLRLLLVREGEQIFKEYLTLEYRGRWTETETNFLTFGEWFIHCSAQCAETIFLNNHRQVACSRHSDSGDSTKKSVSVAKKKTARGALGGGGGGVGSREQGFKQTINQSINFI